MTGVLRVDVRATDGAARTTAITSPRGAYTTPAFMPVATRAAVKHLTSEDLADLGAEFILSNTYHLMLRPGADVVAESGGQTSRTIWMSAPSSSWTSTARSGVRWCFEPS